MSHFKPPGQCPVCHEFVPRKALACDYCGACDKTGWKEDADAYDGVDLPDDGFDYDAFVAQEFGGKTTRRRGMTPLWWWVALVLLLLMVFAAFTGR
jgi:hypothetical protein